MLIAQMTDIHIGFDPDARPEELNRIRFRQTLNRFKGSDDDLLQLWEIARDDVRQWLATGERPASD